MSAEQAPRLRYDSRVRVSGGRRWAASLSTFASCWHVIRTLWGLNSPSSLAIVCGVFLLRGHNWARWLALAWIAFHVVLSAFHAIP